ncbi:hypothetical protein [Pseudomonas sp. NA-150]|uniref:hypothetical protein n=1 Tax=Pseudomonas sp. NA-150 TaxID=3367525 RepID=UPI0037C6F3BD
MNPDKPTDQDPSEAPSTGMPVDSSGKPVNVVQRDLQDTDDASKGVDETITPSSTRTKEQDAEELQRKVAEIERKVADSH